MRKTFTFLFILAAGLANAQDLTGVWHGHFRGNNLSTRSSLIEDRYKFEVQIAQHEKHVEAVTYSYLSSLFYGKAAATGSVNVKNGKVLLQEVKLLEVRNQTGDVCIMTCFLQYSKVGDEEFMEGNFVSMNVRDSSNCGRGTVFLRKTASSDFYKEPFLAKREKELEENAAKGVRPDTNNGTGTAKEPPVMAKTTKPVKPPVKPHLKEDKPLAGTTKPADPVVKNPKPGDPLVKNFKTAPSTPANAATPNHPPATNPNTSARVQKPAVTTPSPGEKANADAKRADARLTDKEAKMGPLPKSNVPAVTAAGKGSDSIAGIGRHFPVITPKILLSRSNVLVRTITVHSNEITLNIYDDGAIDHDTVSVYLDKRQVINHAMLTDRPLVLTLHLDDSEDYHELVMVAENEGEIPPNTSLMIVKAGDKEYEVRITSTEQKNAMVIFRFEKK